MTAAVPSISASGSNLHAILLMAAAMAGFAVEDLMILTAARELPTGQILMMLGAGGTVVFAALMRAKGIALVSRDLANRHVMLRNLSEAAVSVCIVLALSMVPLSVFSSVLQALPLAVTLAAVLFLGERVGWRRWSALAVGFAGVLIILRPGTPAFDPGTLLAVCAVGLLAARDIATRRVPARVESLQVAGWGFAAIVPAGAALLGMSGRAFQMPSPGAWLSLTTALMFGTLAYIAIVRAVRMAETAVVAPFRYSRLIVAMLLAVVVLGERPAPTTLVGAALVIGSGLYTLVRERQISRAAARATASAFPRGR